jgi:hypothetical protein
MIYSLRAEIGTWNSSNTKQEGWWLNPDETRDYISSTRFYRIGLPEEGYRKQVRCMKVSG